MPQRGGNWYNLKYVAISTEIKDENLVEEISKHYARFKTPFLFMHGDNIKLWGCADDEWGIKLLDRTLFLSCGLNFKEKPQLWSRGNIHPNVLREIQLQKAHTRPADTEKTIGDEHNRLQHRSAASVTLFREYSTVSTALHNVSNMISGIL